jgi:uncharacterized membrane protein (UPF0182 family)
MPPTADRRRRGFLRGRGRTIVLVTVVVLVVLAMSLKGIATFYTDFLWFRSLGYTDVWRSVLGARVVLALIFIGLFFALCWSNLYIADRIAPVFRPPGPEEDLLEPYHVFIARRMRLARVLVALLFAVIAGAGAAGQWKDWILFNNRVDFGIDDPQFHRDIGFYVFQLPFLSFVVNWFFFSFVMIFLITAVAHYLNGGIRLQTTGERVTPQVKAHLSLLLGVLALIKVADYYLARFELTTSSRGVVDGATYTDVKVQLPALNLLMAISVLSFVLLIINIRRRGWQLPAVTVGLWAFVALVAGNIYPAFVQRFSVDPAESSKESAYVERNIEFTRMAYNLDNVDSRSFDYRQDLTSEDVLDNIDNVRSARILDPEAMRGAFQLEQAKRTYYRFADELDIDRYSIDGKTTEVVIGARELNPSARDGFENAHLAYTHGNGVALAPANEVNSRGRPSYLIGEVPPLVRPQVSQVDGTPVSLETPQIYYGEGLGGYAIVNAKRDEVDYTDEDEAGGEKEVRYRYAGNGGVELGSVFRRAAFAIRFGQIDPLISNFVGSDSRVIYKRDVADRVESVAPFLKWDSDPYPVVFDGRIVYILDGFTTTNRYPYAQSSSGGGGALSGGGVNYVRNSVKAVVDAYEGSIELYIMPVDDPIIEAYRNAFPKLFKSYEDMPEVLRDHLRYPQDLFRLQTNMWARYHEDNAAAFLSASGRWSVAQDAPREVRAASTDTGQTTVQVADEQAQTRRVAPYYAQLRLPGEDKPSFLTLRTFVAYNTDDTLRQLTSIMVADSSGVAGEYGRLIAYEFTNTDAPGPAAVAANINAKQEVSSEISLLNQQGSTVEYGDLLLIPIENSILYVRPLYVTARDSDFPGLQYVMVSNGQDVELGKSLGEALDNLFRTGDRFAEALGTTAVTQPDVEPPDTNGGQPPSGDVDARITDLVSQILAKQAERDAALRKSPPDNAAAGAAEDEIRRLVDQLAELTGATPGVTSTTTPASTPEGASEDGSSGESPTTTTVPPTTTVRPASA